jgi:UDP-glucose 4-epimerase
MRALVTGGAGFIGSTLTDRLLADGHEVIVIDNLSTGNPANLAGAQRFGTAFRFERADIRDADVVPLIARLAPDAVFHLAAQADVRVSVADPAMDAAVNVIGTINVLEGARRGGTSTVVFASSGGTIYGEAPPEALPLHEDAVRRPLSPYGIAKEASTNYLSAYASMYGMHCASLALGNVYGPRQDAHGEAGVVAIFAGRLLAGEPCTIFGTGEQTRDFVYVDDVVDAFVKAARARVAGLLNIGTGREVSINHLYLVMAEVLGVAAEPQRAPARRGELERNCLDASRAWAVLGWEATTSLPKGLTAVFASLGAVLRPRLDPASALPHGDHAHC